MNCATWVRAVLKVRAYAVGQNIDVGRLQDARVVSRDVVDVQPSCQQVVPAEVGIHLEVRAVPRLFGAEEDAFARQWKSGVAAAGLVANVTLDPRRHRGVVVGR
jgi:hypothetical protein